MSELFLLLSGIIILIEIWYLQRILRKRKAEERRKIRKFQMNLLNQMTKEDKERYQPKFKDGKLILKWPNR